MIPKKRNPKIEQVKLIATVILVIIFFYTFSTNVLFRKKKAGVAAPVRIADPDSQNLTEDLLFVTNLRLKDKQYADQRQIWDKEWGRDPFIPQAAVSQIVKAVNLTLKGVLWDEKNPKAIVNEKTLIIGDTIYGYTVMEIKPRSIVLRTGEKNIELQVFRPLFSDPPAN